VVFPLQKNNTKNQNSDKVFAFMYGNEVGRKKKGKTAIFSILMPSEVSIVFLDKE